MIGQGVAPEAVTVHARAHIRYAGTDMALVVPAFSIEPSVERHREDVRRTPQLPAMKSAFEAAHKSRFGFIDETKDLVVEAVSVEAIGGGTKFTEPVLPTTGDPLPSPTRRTRFYSRGQWHDATVYTRTQLSPGHAVAGPAIVIEPHQTIVVEDGWRASITAKNHLVLERAVGLKRQSAIGTDADPVMLEVFNNLFMSIAEQMGVSLQNTAYSVNIKERLDFSCAVFDADGTLVANAPHMPVHLGSMDRAVETIIRENKGRIAPGDVYAINAPYNGGTHLPDITVCTPVFDEAGREVLFWVASRGHHADVGGISPGSMSPNAITIEEEGVYIDNFKLVDRGRFRERALYDLLTGAKYPARNPLQNVNDMKAQIAANEKGVQELRKTVAHFTLPVVRGLYATRAGQRGRKRAAGDRPHPRCVIRIRDGPGHLDQGQDQRRQGEARGDRRFHRYLAAAEHQFQRARTGHARGGALCLSRHGRRRHPDECRLPAADQHRHSEAIDPVAGISRGGRRRQRGNIASGDRLPVRRAGRLAAAQGTMNNLNFGNARYQYYETICSGSPAGPGFPGTDAVHTHMTNTRLTDPEVLEFRYPVLLEDFHIRTGSGGRGEWNAGDGVRRTIRFLEKMDCTILSGHRRVRPFGLAGGESGQVGENTVRRNDGRMEKLKGADATVIDAGEAVIIQTPTAGGYGKPK